MKEYKELLQHILDNGTVKTDRTGVGTISVFGYQTRFDLSKGFPAVTTKKLAWKAVLSELLWFIEGSTDERRLAEIYYGKPRTELVGKTTIWTANADAQGKAMGYENTDTVKQLGNVYGKMWRCWPTGKGVNIDGHYKPVYYDQLKRLISDIKTTPDSRRLILTAWNSSEIESMALPPCHMMCQFNVTDNKLSCQLYQRSADTFLGSAFNIASYAILTHMIAQVCNLQVGDLVYTIGDAHIYSNHVEQVKELLSREPLGLSTIHLNPNITDIDKFTMNDIWLTDYQSHPAILAPMAV